MLTTPFATPLLHRLALQLLDGIFWNLVAPCTMFEEVGDHLRGSLAPKLFSNIGAPFARKTTARILVNVNI
jgi:hypothetical protein